MFLSYFCSLIYSGRFEMEEMEPETRWGVILWKNGPFQGFWIAPGFCSGDFPGYKYQVLPSTNDIEG